jgi:hypothetical protein
MEYYSFMMYKPKVSCAGRANIKNGTGLLKDLCRRDIAPTGELAGLPARDAPKTSEVWPRSITGEASDFLANDHPFDIHAHKRS